MDTVYLNISGSNIKIVFKKTAYCYPSRKLRKDLIHDLKNFQTDCEPKEVDFTIIFIEKETIENIARDDYKKYLINFYEHVEDNKIITFYHISTIQFQIILRNILQTLLFKSNGFILHAAASCINNKAYIFLGKPSSGKSTAMRLLKRKYPPLADDTIIIKQKNNNFTCYQTPAIEKEYLIKKSKNSYPIGGIFFLRKSKDFRIEKINNKNVVLQKLISQLFTEREMLKKQINYIAHFISEYDKFYFLDFAKNSQKLIELFTTLHI